MAVYEKVELIDIEATATIVHKRLYAILLGFAFAVVVLVAVVAMMVVPFVIVMLVMIMIVAMFVIVMMMMSTGLGFLLVGGRFFYFVHPGCRRGYIFKVKKACIEQLGKIDVAIVALDDTRFGLDGADDGPYAAGLLGAYLRYLIEQDDVAEFDLFDDKTFDILLVDFLACESLAAAKLALHPQGIHHSDDTVERRHAVAIVLRLERRDRTDGLRDRRRLADAARLDHDIVELVRRNDLGQLLDKIHLQRAADTSVLQRHQVARILAAHDAAFLYERRIDIDLAYIVDYHSEAYAALVGKDAVEESCLAAAEIARKQQHRYVVFHCYDTSVLLYKGIKF